MKNGRLVRCYETQTHELLAIDFISLNSLKYKLLIITTGCLNFSNEMNKNFRQKKINNRYYPKGVKFE